MMQAKAAPIEYIVYTFDRPAPSRQKGDAPWKRHFCSLDRDQALETAQNLLRSRKFDRIEIKKKFFDEGQNRVVDKTVKILKARRNHAAIKTMLKLLVGTEALALAGYLLIYLP